MASTTNTQFVMVFKMVESKNLVFMVYDLAV